MKRLIFLSFIVVIQTIFCQTQKNFILETKAEYNSRMGWWKEARFGLFIHWGLYSVPAGEWKGKTEYGEWIRTSAEIPLEEYDKFVQQFNPLKFNADEWVKTAKDAGMKYIVITSKHHDGFCLFDSKYTDFDIMSTPFKRDILKELSEACKKYNLKLCFYYSIMDWHHPDYLPRRDWEKTRSSESANYNRYLQYMKNQLRELLTNYGPIGVLWFDGEWENSWNRDRGKDLYNYVRSLQPDIIINNRVGAGRSGMEGFSEDSETAGDFGTPEQQIPSTGLPDVYWETCMTMNDHWGYNSHDQNWKSSKDLIRMLTDIASKGGNFLLNVGPTSEGVFPKESLLRLNTIGEWLKVNGEAIYGTDLCPFKFLPFGRCTKKRINNKTRLYFHVFEYPKFGKLTINGISNYPEQVYLLSDQSRKMLKVTRYEDALTINLPELVPDTINTVVVVEVDRELDVHNPPVIDTEMTIFIDTITVNITSDRNNVEIRYTEDGNIPSITSKLLDGPIYLTQTSKISARCFRNNKPVSGTSEAIFTKVEPKQSLVVNNLVPGINFSYYEGDWDSLPNFSLLKPLISGTLPNINFSPRKTEERFGFEYRGYIMIPKEGVYTFYTASDDGSRLYIDGDLVVDNDQLHPTMERKGVVALETGLHSFRVLYFEKTGLDELKVLFRGPGVEKQIIPDSLLFHD